MARRPLHVSMLELLIAVVSVALATTIVIGIWRWNPDSGSRPRIESVAASTKLERPTGGLRNGDAPRIPLLDTSGFTGVASAVPGWAPNSSLAEISDIWRKAPDGAISNLNQQLADVNLPDLARASSMMMKSFVLNAKGETALAYQLQGQLRALMALRTDVAPKALASLIYAQGVTALRMGENENCVMCRGESSCIFPITPAAVHLNPNGSRLAIGHFTEYLEQFPDDLEVRWLLNLAHMTLGEYADRVDSRLRLDLSRYFQSEFDIGKFRDVGHSVGVNRFNQAGGAIMDDFDNDGLLDLVVSSTDSTQQMSYYRNKGDGAFEDRSQQAGVTDQLGGLVCYQADYDNDGYLDIVVPRAAWMSYEIRPSLLRNNGAGGFEDVTARAGLMAALNSNAAAWADFDNDGNVDFFIACEQQDSRLYRNKGDGTFEDVAARAGVKGNPTLFCKGCNWIDYDNDDYPDLFVNNLTTDAQLYHNERNGTFTEITLATGIRGPRHGFSCWAWDFDNDGWLDIFATSYDRSVADVVKGMLGQPHSRFSNRLYRNHGDGSFDDVTAEAGLDLVLATMGSNFGDFDNDGFLDMYLGTGDPTLATLVPNRMFKNVAGERFSEITASSRTGHLQKGHGVACGDWDRDGDVDLFVETGGAVNGDKYHNVLFQNPGQGNHWLTVKLVGKKTNRAAIGARIKVVTGGDKPLTVYRHVSSGSSFGGNPLEQTIGLGRATRVAQIEIHWPTSGTTQIFHDIPADQAIELTEFAESFRSLDWKPLPQPE